LCWLGARIAWRPVKNVTARARFAFENATRHAGQIDDEHHHL
jgi:hypothetical protein